MPTKFFLFLLAEEEHNLIPLVSELSSAVGFGLQAYVYNFFELFSLLTSSVHSHFPLLDVSMYRFLRCVSTLNKESFVVL